MDGVDDGASSDCGASIGEELTVVDELLDSSLMVGHNETPDRAARAGSASGPAGTAAALASIATKKKLSASPKLKSFNRPANQKSKVDSIDVDDSSHAGTSSALTASLPQHNWFEQKLQQETWLKEQRLQMAQLVGIDRITRHAKY